MSWEVTIEDVQAGDGDNTISKLDPQISQRGRWLPSSSGECVDKAFSPDITTIRDGAFSILGISNSGQPWSSIYPERYQPGSDSSNLSMGNGTTIARYEYEVDEIAADIKVTGVVEKTNGEKFECAFNLESQAVAGLHTNKENQNDLYDIIAYIKDGQPLNNKVNNRVAEVSEIHGSSGEIKYKRGDLKGTGMNPYSAAGESLQTTSEIYGAAWPLTFVKPFQDWDNDYAEISWTDGHHYYETAETYTMQDANGNTITKPITWVDFDIYMGARIAWNADLFDHTFPNPNYGPFGYGYSEKLSERPGFVKVELGEDWEDEGSNEDTGGRLHGPDDPRWPFTYGGNHGLNATMKTLKVHVPRARCLGLWEDVLNININAGWYTDTVFDEPVSLPRELKVVYKGITKTKMITPPGYFSNDSEDNWEYWTPTDSVATITFRENGTFDIY